MAESLTEPSPTLAKAACWVVSDGTPGMESQCLGLAAALGLAPRILRVRLPPPWRWLPPALVRAGPARLPFPPPWPDLLIATGRHSLAAALAVKRASKGRTFLVQIQNPGVPLGRFDLVVLPEHDGIAAPNAIATLGALGLVTPQRLAATPSRHELERLPRPWAAVLLGGRNRAYAFDGKDRAQLARQLLDAQRAGWSLAITPSRRTPPELLEQLGSALTPDRSWIWAGAGKNPYLALLAGADAFLVTPDSINMASEAAATGKPVHLLTLVGNARAAKFERFHRALIGRGCARPFDGGMQRWTYPALAETERVAEEVRRRYALRQADRGSAASI